jgi:hypothetical protein
MTDVLGPLLSALPRVEQWVRQLRQERRATSQPVSAMGFPKLATCFPSHVLNSTRVEITDDLPFPPVEAYGIPEFEVMAKMPMAGITFSDLYFVRPAHSTESMHFHEVIHVIQWRALEVREFLLTYAAGFVQNGYERNPLEQIAFDLQARFESGPPLVDVAGAVVRHASQCRDNTVAGLRAAGQKWSA